MSIVSILRSNTFALATTAAVGVAVAVAFHVQALGADLGAVFRPLVASVCSGTSACLQWSNSSTGPGLKGISAAGKGVVGQTSFNSTSSSNGQSGIWGTDGSQSGVFDAGVKGMSVRGTGVSGSSSAGNGVSAVSFTGSGIFAQSTVANGVYATSASNDGINASTTNRSGCLFCRGRSGIYAHDDSADGGHLNVGVAGGSINGIGVNGVSSHFVGINAMGGLANLSTGDDFPALSVVGNATDQGLLSFPNDMIDGCPLGTVPPCDSKNADFRVDSGGQLITKYGVFVGSDLTVGGAPAAGLGDIDITGEYLKGGACVAGCAGATATSSGRSVVSYGSTATIPTVEDFGEGQLLSGQAYVALDPAFANAIDHRSQYLVFITPEGSSRGLYVTQKTLRGFAVRENLGGQSTVSFSFRVVAKPFGVNRPRLPMVSTPRLGQIQRFNSSGRQ